MSHHSLSIGQIRRIGKDVRSSDIFAGRLEHYCGVPTACRYAQRYAVANREGFGVSEDCAFGPRLFDWAGHAEVITDVPGTNATDQIQGQIHIQVHAGKAVVPR